MLEGTIHVFLAQALFPLTVLITTAFLTRPLGPEGYGLLVLTATLVVWVEVSIHSLFSRAAIKFVGEAANRRPIGSAIARLHHDLPSSCPAVGCAHLWGDGSGVMISIAVAIVTAADKPRWTLILTLTASRHFRTVRSLAPFPHRDAAAIAATHGDDLRESVVIHIRERDGVNCR